VVVEVRGGVVPESVLCGGVVDMEPAGFDWLLPEAAALLEPPAGAPAFVPEVALALAGFAPLPACANAPGAKATNAARVKLLKANRLSLFPNFIMLPKRIGYLGR